MIIQRDEAAAIIVAEERSGAIRTCDVHQVVQQQFELWLQLRRRTDPVETKQDCQVNVKIRRVTVIVARLLEVHAIGFDVSRQLRDENLETQVAPTFSVFEFRRQESEIEKSECLAREMCVRAEVRREISLEMQRIQIQKLLHAQPQIRGERRRLFEEL